MYLFVTGDAKNHNITLFLSQSCKEIEKLLFQVNCRSSLSYRPDSRPIYDFISPLIQNLISSHNNSLVRSFCLQQRLEVWLQSLAIRGHNPSVIASQSLQCYEIAFHTTSHCNLYLSKKKNKKIREIITTNILLF